MIRKLQRKFVLISMLSVFAVLGAIMLAVNLFNYSEVYSYYDTVLDELQANDGAFASRPQPQMQKDRIPNEDEFTAETPFETRYFIVEVATDGSILRCDISRIAAVNETEAQSLAISALSSRKTKGMSDNYRYSIAQIDNGSRVIFVDCSRQLANAQSFLRTGIIISLLGMLAVFVLVVFFSKLVFKPVESTFIKQKQFITDASHELKTPLTIISANNELLEMEKGENERTRSIARQVARMTEMAKNLTTLARLDESEGDVRKYFDLSDTLLDAIAPYDTICQSKGKTMKLSVPESIGIVGDEASVRMLITILADNCIKYADSTIEFALICDKNTVTLSARNDFANGDFDVDKAFDRFYRSNSARASDVEGSGIGLSMAKRIMELHSGDIKAEYVGGFVTIYATFVK